MGKRWQPCQYPERPIDADTGWHLGCAGCHVAAIARRARGDAATDRHAVIILNLTAPRCPEWNERAHATFPDGVEMVGVDYFAGFGEAAAP